MYRTQYIHFDDYVAAQQGNYQYADLLVTLYLKEPTDSILVPGGMHVTEQIREAAAKYQKAKPKKRKLIISPK